MAFQLNNVVPWGRNMDEYKSMFLLNEEDMKKKIAGFGDGPASFNFEAGLSEGRYRYHELPNCIPVEENYYDIGLSSHILLLY